MKRLIALLLCLLLLTGMPACGGPQKYTAQLFAFDTLISLTAYCDSDRAFQELRSTLFGRLGLLHQKYDIYNEYPGMTNLCTVNRAAGQPTAVDGDIARLLDLSRQLYEQTGGLVNIAHGRLYGLWRQARETGALPDSAALEAAMSHGDWQDLLWEPAGEGGTVTLLDREMALDVGAVAKGLAVQLAVEEADRLGYTDYALSAGGNVVTRGHAQGGRPWSVGIRDPLSADSAAHIAVVESEDLALVTSGGYERTLVVEGKSYCHIIDPRTGYPADSMLSATAVTAHSGMADGWSTALFLMTPQQALAFAEVHGFRAILVDREGRMTDTAKQ